MNKLVLSVENINVSFKEHHVLKGVDFKLYEKDAIAIIGENGAGKTVLIETILGLVKKQEGKIYLNLGEKTFFKNLNFVGVQYQTNKFDQYTTPGRIINYYKKIYKKRINEDHIQKMKEIFKLNSFLKQKIHKCSAGQLQRLNLFLAVMHNPKLLILDEFSTSLDIHSVKKILEYVHEYCKKNKISLIIISHQPKEIEMLAKKIMLLKDGKITKQLVLSQLVKKTTIEKFMEKEI